VANANGLIDWPVERSSEAIDKIKKLTADLKKHADWVLIPVQSHEVI